MGFSIRLTTVWDGVFLKVNELRTDFKFNEAESTVAFHGCYFQRQKGELWRFPRY
jgi:hypothetical protein